MIPVHRLKSPWFYVRWCREGPFYSGVHWLNAPVNPHQSATWLADAVLPWLDYKPTLTAATLSFLRPTLVIFVASICDRAPLVALARRLRQRVIST